VAKSLEKQLPVLQKTRVTLYGIRQFCTLLTAVPTRTLRYSKLPSHRQLVYHT